MTEEEIDRIFNLLRSLHPRAQQFRDKNVRRAWGLVLEPFSYKSVRENILTHARRHAYPPDIHDLTKGLNDIIWMRDFIGR